MHDLSKKWPKMNPLLKEEIIEYLEWKMEGDWKLVPKEEVRAMHYLSYGDWGPRSPSGQTPTSPTFLIWKGLFNTILFLALGVSIINLKRDKAMDEKIERLKSLSTTSPTV